ncbi:phage head-tail adaptor [Mizugakiibacter sediminis]|uniref:Head-tail adaptor protein n=1 Tax=Mizugakiibacter sediminis TaxID=1475481 RepID=A0A0K8QQZ7_9GAMM|nr:phage head closure protein [Mizugakiibacter sediminis]GAP66797.1 phage head-tail adaptor [Mizugakiibacter sediminis]
MTLAAGKLNRRITIQQRTAGQDAAGQPVLTWADVASVWANVAGDTGLHTIRASGDLPAPVKRYSFRIRYRDGLNEGMRVVLGGQNFDIKTVRMDFAGRVWTDLVCELGANDG